MTDMSDQVTGIEIAIATVHSVFFLPCETPPIISDY